MKTIRIFFTVMLTFSASILIADNDPDYITVPIRGAGFSIMKAALTPALPKEADFEEVDFSCTIPVPVSLFRKTTPPSQGHAGFDDDILPVHVGKLVPVVPPEADF